MTVRQFLKHFELPITLHEIIKLNMKNLKNLQKNKNYIIDHNIWHDYFTKEKACVVCFGGCFLAQSLKFPHKTFYQPKLPSLHENHLEPFKEQLDRLLFSLNYFRALQFESSIRYFYDYGSVETIRQCHEKALDAINKHIGYYPTYYPKKYWDPNYIEDSPKKVNKVITILKDFNV